MSDYINDREIRVIGLSRSGNHAIMQWMLAQAQGRVCFLNCAEGKSNPFVSARPLEHGRSYEASHGDFDLEAERQGRHTPKDYLIFNHEDSFLAHACSDIYEREHDRWVGPSRRRYDVLILRDPFNLFASRLNRRGRHLVRPGAALRIWKQHARQFIEDTRRLRGQPVLISYNHWFGDKDYRRQVAAQMGLTFTDAGLRNVPGCYGGSSFDGMRFAGQAQQMRVLERWRHFADDPGFRSLFDTQMVELSGKIFGHLPGTEELIGRRTSRQAG